MEVSEKWIRDTGLVFGLIFLLLGWGGNQYFLAASVVVLGALLFAPMALWPLAWAWLKLTLVLGYVMNRVFFGIVFFIVVTPIGLLRRALKGETRDLEKQEEKDTAFVVRNHLVVPEDLAKPF